MLTIRELVLITLLPGGAAAGVAAVLFWALGPFAPFGARLRSRLGLGARGSGDAIGVGENAIGIGRDAIGVAIAVGYVVGQFIRFGGVDFSEWQAIEGWQWLWIAVGGAVLAFMARWAVPVSWWVAAGLGGLWFVGLMVVTLRPYWENSWSGGEAMVWVGGVSAGYGLFRWFWGLGGPSVVDPLLRGGVIGSAMLLVSVGTAGLLLVTGSQRLGELGIVLSSAMGGALVVAWVRGHLASVRGGLSVFAMIVAGLWVNGWFYSETPWWAVAAWAATPGAAWVGAMAVGGGRSWQRAGVVYLSIVCISLAAVLAPLVVRFIREAGEGGLEY